MQANVSVLGYAVVERGWLPIFCEEDHAYCLAKVVELQTASADSRHDAGIWNGLNRDRQFAGSQNQVRVGGCPDRALATREGS